MISPSEYDLCPNCGYEGYLNEYCYECGYDAELGNYDDEITVDQVDEDDDLD